MTRVDSPVVGAKCDGRDVQVPPQRISARRDRSVVDASQQPTSDGEYPVTAVWAFCSYAFNAWRRYSDEQPLALPPVPQALGRPGRDRADIGCEAAIKDREPSLDQMPVSHGMADVPKQKEEAQPRIAPHGSD